MEKKIFTFDQLMLIDTKYGQVPHKHELLFGTTPDLRIQTPRGLYKKVLKQSSDCLGLLCIFSPFSTLLDGTEECLKVRHERDGVGHQEMIPYYQLVNFIRSFILEGGNYYRQYVTSSSKTEFQSVLKEYVDGIGIPSVFDSYLLMYTQDLTVLYNTPISLPVMQGIGFYDITNRLWEVPKEEIVIPVDTLVCRKDVVLDCSDYEAIAFEVQKGKNDLVRVSLEIADEISEPVILDRDMRSGLISVSSLYKEYKTMKLTIRLWMLQYDVKLVFYKGRFPENFYAVQCFQDLYVCFERKYVRIVFRYPYKRTPCSKHSGLPCGLYCIEKYCLKDLLDPGASSKNSHTYVVEESIFLKILYGDIIVKDSLLMHPASRRKF